MRALKVKALFLDRDGVINVDHDYVHRSDQFDFIEGIFDLCRRFGDAGYKIIVVTNQSGIARGKYSEEDFEILTSWMCEAFLKEGVEITHVYHCPHHPEITGECDCRKPLPGMLLAAQAAYHIDMPSSVMIGDKERDIKAAQAAHVGRTILFGRAETSATQKTTDLSEIQC